VPPQGNTKVLLRTRQLRPVNIEEAVRTPEFSFGPPPKRRSGPEKGKNPQELSSPMGYPVRDHGGYFYLPDLLHARIPVPA
jgi:hypothetical protein